VKELTEITIIGFGNQAKAWALNMRDSGLKVHIGLRPNSSSKSLAKELGFNYFNIEATEIPTKNFVLLIPDDKHLNALTEIEKINDNKVCIYAHGYSLTKSELNIKFPAFQHILLAPKSIASEVRYLFETKGNISAIYSNEHAPNVSIEQIQLIASKVGIKNIFPASFKEETEADLFSEQSILCSLLPYGALQTFNTLRAEGYPKELAFFECFYEVKLIADTLLKVGPEKFFDLISPNALIGSKVGKELLFDNEFQNKLNTLVNNIQNGKFDKIVESTNIEDLRNEMKQFWSKQELNSTYEDLKGIL
jgi:ketol-acid reductoisomerase